MAQYDLIIRNGEIYDGSGDAPFKGDVAILDGVIARIASHIEGTANREIDATDHIVTRGFRRCGTPTMTVRQPGTLI